MRRGDATTSWRGKKTLGWRNDRGSSGKNVIFQIASGSILSIPIHSNTCKYEPCKVLLKKMNLSLPMNLPKSVFFVSSDWARY